MGSTARWESWSAGSETCRHCLQTYRVELERFCADCDGPVCAFCVERHAVHGTLQCPECRPPASRRNAARGRALAGAAARRPA